MPQLDKVTYFSQVATLISSFIIFYFIIVKRNLTDTAKILKLRNKSLKKLDAIAEGLGAELSGQASASSLKKVIVASNTILGEAREAVAAAASHTSHGSNNDSVLSSKAYLNTLVRLCLIRKGLIQLIRKMGPVWWLLNIINKNKMKQALIFYLIFISVAKGLIVLNEKLLVAIAAAAVALYGEQSLSSQVIDQLESRANLIKQQYEEGLNRQKKILVELAGYHREKVQSGANDPANDLFQLVNSSLALLRSYNQTTAAYQIQTKISSHLESIKAEELAILATIQKEVIIGTRNLMKGRFPSSKQGGDSQQRNKIITRAIASLKKRDIA